MKIPNYAKSTKYIDRGLKTFNLREPLFKEIKKKLKSGKKIRLLEIGCGKGILLSQLLTKYPRKLELCGLNLNKHHGIKSQQDFRTNASDYGIILPKNITLPLIFFSDATRMPFEDTSFDIIISQVTFLHIKNKAKAIEEAYRILGKGGLALISLGPYSIRRKTNHAMPNFYKNLNKKLEHDYNPRFLLKSGKEYIRLSPFIREIKNKHDIRLWTHKFVSATQRAQGFWLIIRKENTDVLKLGLKYDKKSSQKLTKAYAKNNPVNFGCIDVYEKINHA